MKKVISVLLAALMLMSCFGVASFAAEGECKCGPGVHTPGIACTCCLNCPNIDTEKLNSCYNIETGEKCCGACTAFYGCRCGCPCCDLGDEYIEDSNGTLDKVVTEQDKENFVDGFQAILKKISDFFETIFDAIFEFLKIDQVLGKGDTPPESQ